MPVASCVCLKPEDKTFETTHVESDRGGRCRYGPRHCAARTNFELCLYYGSIALWAQNLNDICTCCTCQAGADDKNRNKGGCQRAIRTLDLVTPIGVRSRMAFIVSHFVHLFAISPISGGAVSERIRVFCQISSTQNSPFARLLTALMWEYGGEMQWLRCQHSVIERGSKVLCVNT